MKQCDSNSWQYQTPYAPTNTPPNFSNPSCIQEPNFDPNFTPYMQMPNSNQSAFTPYMQMPNLDQSSFTPYMQMPSLDQSNFTPYMQMPNLDQSNFTPYMQMPNSNQSAFTPYPNMSRQYSNPFFQNNMYSYNPFTTPIGVPFPSYSNYEAKNDTEKDMDYLKKLYPKASRELLKEVETECDKLEYNGSCMYHQYPDKTYLARIIDKIYDRVQNLDKPLPALEKDLESNELSSPNWLKTLIGVMFYNEVLNRRIKYKERYE